MPGAILVWPRTGGFPEAQAPQSVWIKSTVPATSYRDALINTLQPDEALRYLERVALERSSANSLWNLSLAYLLTGFGRGWEYYEARFATENFEHCSRPTSDAAREPQRMFQRSLSSAGGLV